MALDKLHEAEQRVTDLAQELIKAETRGRFMTLTAPVDGVVQPMSAHMVSGVVTPVQPLLVIVPSNNPLEVEAFTQTRASASSMPGRKPKSKSKPFRS